MHKLLLLTSLSFLSTALPAADFDVYFLGGQSNMDGYGFVNQLPDDLKDKPVEGAWIFHGNMGTDGTPADGRGMWSPLKAGHGRDFKSDGQTNRYSDRFGAELTFAKKLRELHPDRKVAIIKYSRGGTSISSAANAAKRFGCWDPEWTGGEGDGRGVNQFDHFQATLRHAREDRDIDNDGQEDRLVIKGIIWMQGESDSEQSEVAAQYRENLASLMGLIRKELGNENARVVIGRITNWPVWTHGEVVRKAQADFVAADKNAALVTSTDQYGNSDKWHYDTAGYLDLGQEFAQAMAGQ